MKTVKDALRSAAEFVEDHKVAIAVGVSVVATAALSIAVQRSAIKDWNEFLQTEGLTGKFYTPIS